MNRPLISIVLCTYNREGMLREALASLATLETMGLFDYEIVVVDNASTDATPQVVDEFRGTTPWPVVYARETQQGIVYARNRGLREAHGEWLAFFDDDQLADARWLLELWLFATESHCLAVGGSVVLKLPEDCQRQLHPTVRMLLGEAHVPGQPFAYSHQFTFGCGNLMVHRRVFERIGEFNERFAMRAEDTDLFCRMQAAGIASWYVPTALVQHLTPYVRLEMPYLTRLAKHVGENVAQREFDVRSRLQFTLRWCLKALRWQIWQRTKAKLHAWLGHSEQALGCELAAMISGFYLAEGRRLLQTAASRNWSWWPARKTAPAGKWAFVAS